SALRPGNHQGFAGANGKPASGEPQHHSTEIPQYLKYVTKVGAGQNEAVAHFFQALEYLWRKGRVGMEYLFHSGLE
ncbi:MAG: hypothetical protein J5I98_16485, partial [Phaeodactylibacter sp.]|nr:hypothetical protein [Phaeodactylibacter sp.]